MLAAFLVVLEGLVSVGLTVALLVAAIVERDDLKVTLSTAGWFAVCAGGLIGIGLALRRGAYAARTPAIVVQLLLVGVSWYAISSSGRPEFGIPGGLFCLVVLGLLFAGPSTRWAYGGADISDRRDH